MAHESLEDAFAFLDEAELAPSGDSASLSLLESDGWDSNSLLDALDSDIGDLPTGNSTATETSEPDQTLTRGRQEQKTAKRKKPNKNKARDERRFVLTRLRDEVEKLQFTLQQLQRMRGRQPAAIAPSRDGAENTSEVPLVWQDICARQLRHRLKAEQKNVQLKDQYEREKQLVKSIEKLLFKRRVPKETEKHARRTDIPPGYIERMTTFIFDELAASIEIMFRQVEGVLEASSSIPTVQRPLLRGGMKCKEEKLYDRKVLPFSMHVSGDAWWRNWHNHRGRSIQDSSGDTVVETFGLETSDFNANASVISCGQQILRRSVEEHRIMFVWNAYIEPFVYGNERVSGIYFLEQCHVFVKPEDSDTMSDEDESSSCMSTCYVITPYVLDPTLQRNPKTSALIDFFVGSMFATIKARSEMVENLLLDEALEKCKINQC